MEVPNLEKTKKEIKTNIINNKAKLVGFRYHLVNDRENIQKELINFRENLLVIYADSMASNNDDSFNRLQQWSYAVSGEIVNQKLSIEDVMEEAYFSKSAIDMLIKEEAKHFGLTIDDFFGIISSFHAIVEQAGQLLSVAYKKDYTKKIKACDSKVRELSTPMLKITESIGVFPLVGDIDKDRAKQLMETALTKGSALKIKYIIFDLSGVPAIDEWVAAQLLRFVGALRIIGIETELSGIRPEIAQKLVGLGIEFKTIPTFSSLQQAIDFVYPNHQITTKANY